jgi:hypothetical protein
MGVLVFSGVVLFIAASVLFAVWLFDEGYDAAQHEVELDEGIDYDEEADAVDFERLLGGAA